MWYNGVMNKKLDDFKSAFDERDYRFKRIELLIYGLYAVLFFLGILPYLIVSALFS